MAYAILKDRAIEEDRLIRSWGKEAMAVDALDREIGFLYEEDDEDEPVATIHQLKDFIDHWNAKM